MGKKNTFLDNLENTPLGRTENDGVCYNTTKNYVLDLCAMGAACRNRDESDIIDLFKNAYNQNKLDALRCLFYIGDIRGGQGERRFFRTCYKWLIKNDPQVAKKNLIHIPFYKRWDDLIYICIDTDLQDAMIKIIGEQLVVDLNSKTPSLLGKWMPSENASSKETKRIATILRKALEYDSKTYRKHLSTLRAKINIVETLITQGRYSEIEYDKIPSVAGFKYRNAFATHDYERYNEFMNKPSTKVNASTLYPYQIVQKALEFDKNNATINKYWESLPDYLNGDESNTICVVDTSGSMHGIPICVAISLGMYFGERNKGPFTNKFITFSSRPQLVNISGQDFVDKVRKIYGNSIIEDTNIEAVFDLLLNTAKKNGTKKEDIPRNIMIISDMEFNHAQDSHSDYMSEFDVIKKKWIDAGFEMPHLIFWNVDSRQNNIPIIDKTSPVSFISGMSPSIFTSIITGKSGEELLKEILSKYSNINI